MRTLRFLALVCGVAVGYGGLVSTFAAVAGEAAAMIPTAWLQKKISVAEAEAAYPGVKDDRSARVPDATKPFGFAHQEWDELKAAMLPGDEIWTFASSPESWRDLAGRAGVALVRNGVPIKVIITAMN